MATFKLLHCADLHLDSKMKKHLTEAKAKKRRAELMQTFERMVAYADVQGISAVIIAGDLFDQGKVSSVTGTLVLNVFASYPEIDFYYLKGNHDEARAFSREDIPANLHLFERDTWTEYALDEAGSVFLYGRENWGFPPMMQAEHMNLVVLHGQISESKGEDRIYLKDFRTSGIDYLALGHLHSYQTGEIDGRGTYCYPGCLEGRGFDETGEHGFVVLTVDTDQRKIRPEFVPFANRHFYELSLDISDCTNTLEVCELIEAFLDQSARTDDVNNFVRLLLTGFLQADTELDLDYIQQKFKDRFYYVELKDKTKWKIDYDAYAHDASLLGEFVRMVQEDASMDEEEKALVIHMGMSALQNESLIEEE